MPEFLSRRKYYKMGCCIKDDEFFIKLLECCEEELKRNLFRNTRWEYDKLDEEQLLTEMKQLTGRAQNPLVNRVVLLTNCTGIIQFKHRKGFAMNQ